MFHGRSDKHWCCICLTFLFPSRHSVWESKIAQVCACNPSHDGRLPVGAGCIKCSCNVHSVRLQESQVVKINTECSTTACFINRLWFRPAKRHSSIINMWLCRSLRAWCKPNQKLLCWEPNWKTVNKPRKSNGGSSLACIHRSSQNLKEVRQLSGFARWRIPLSELNGGRQNEAVP